MKSFEKEKIYVDIPKGIDSGEIIKIKKRVTYINEHTIKEILRYLLMLVNNSEFKRNGLNLIVNKKLSLKEALCGFKFEFKHLNDKTYAINNEEGNIIKPNYQKR